MAEIKIGPVAHKVLKLVAKGMSRSEIAKELDVRADTVREHIKALRTRGLIKDIQTEMGYMKPTVKVDLKSVKSFDPWNGTVAVME